MSKLFLVPVPCEIRNLQIKSSHSSFLFIIWKRKPGFPAFRVVICSLAVLSEPTVEVVEQTKMAEAVAGESQSSASELLFGRLAGGFQQRDGLAASRALKFISFECIFPLYEFNRS